MMRSTPSFGTFCTLGTEESFEESKSCPGTRPMLRQPRKDWRIFGIGRVLLHQLGQQLEEAGRVHPLDLLADGSFHIDRRIDFSGRRRIRLAVGAERHELVLVLERVHGRVILGRAGAIGAAEDPDQIGGQPKLLDAGRKFAVPAGSDDGELTGTGPGGTSAGVGKTSVQPSSIGIR